MSLARAVLVSVQALCNHYACTPPNPTEPKRRYHTEEMYILQIAPFIFKCHQRLAWICAVFEVLHYIQTILPSTTSPFLDGIVCPASPGNIRVTPSFLCGVLSVILGSYIRLDCFRTLGQMFTFDLTVHPEHKLVTRRFYGWVRHPAYTGSMLLVVGLAFSHLTRGSWLTECGPLRQPQHAFIVWGLWWAWTFCVGLSRATAEDRQMRQLFKEDWDSWAAAVPWWFIPGLI